MKLRSTRLPFRHFVWCFLVLGCESEVPQRKQPVADKPVVASFPGIVQVGQGSDPLIDEMVACSRFRAALVDNAERLECEEFEVQDCPDLVHPLVDLPCVMYSEPSVSECEKKFDNAKTCDALGPGSCVLTAILDPTDAQGIPLECEERDSTDMSPDASSILDAGDASDAAAGDASSGDAAMDAAMDSGTSLKPDAGRDAATGSAASDATDDPNSTAIDAAMTNLPNTSESSISADAVSLDASL